MINQFVEYMKERENVRIRKERGDPWPWTEDKILQTYKFTNVHRVDDRTTKALVDIYRNHSSANPSTALYNCALFRYFGTSEFAQDVGWQENFHPSHLLMVAKTRLAAGKRVFTGAYVITNGGLKEPKENVVVRYLGGLWEAKHEIIRACTSTHLGSNVQS